MKERGIIFSGEMVKAILAGAKTQTRRVINPQPSLYSELRGKDVSVPVESHEIVGPFCHFYAPIEREGGKAGVGGMFTVKCPHGSGDRLWVRETWEHESYGGLPVRKGEAHDIRVRYVADSSTAYFIGPPSLATRNYTKKPSIYMPRAYSRITLEITSVRVERLQDISVDDIIAEGLNTTLREHDAFCDLHEKWIQGWDSLNGKRAPWASNPWIWAILFKRVQ